MEINDFQQSKLSLDSYNLEEFKTGLSLPSASAAQLAAGEVIMNDEPSMDQYRSIKQDLLSTTGRHNFILRQEAKRAAIISAYEQELGDVLVNPDLTPEEKQTFVDGVRNAPQNYKPNTIDMMAEEAVAAMSTPDETEAAYESRLKFVDMIEEVNQYKREQTARINGLRAQADPSLMETAVDIGELLIPFAEWQDVDSMYRDLYDKDIGEGAILMGSQREKLFKVMEKLPYDKRAEMAEKLIEYVSEHSQIVLPDGNDLVALDTLQQMIVEEDYSNTEKWLDNVFSVIEFSGVFALLRGTGKSAKAVKAATRSEVSPTSPSQVVKDANPEQARKIHTAAATDESGEAAEALYGTNQTEAVAKDVLPEPEMEPGVVENKVVVTGPQFEEPSDVRSLRTEDGRTYISEAETARVQQKVVDDLSEVQGMKVHNESLTIRTNTDGSMGISVMYRPTDSGFKTADQALSNAKYALRNYGITEDNLTLYRRTGDKWVVTSQKELAARKALRDEFTKKKQRIPERLKEIDYAVGLDYNYYFKPEDLEVYDILSTGKAFGILPLNILDRTRDVLAAKGQGSLTQNLLDAASVLHPQIFKPAGVAVDRGVALKKSYIKMWKGFTKGYKKLPRDRRVMMDSYIHEANFEGIKFDITDLYSRGFNEKEIEILKEWRKSNDVMYYAMNDDMAKSLRNNGYRIYENSANDTRLVVKPMKRGSVSASTKYYDPNTNQIETAPSKDWLDGLYAEGGQYAALAEPVKVGDEWIDIIKVDGTPNSGFMRAISTSERVLNYRDGYYPLMYDANFFIFKTMKKADGTEFQKTIASAKTREDAEKMRDMLRSKEPEANIDFRPDRRADPDKATAFDEQGWSLGVTSGLSAQRIRGERLIDASGDINKAGMSNLVDPLEAISKQIEQLSSRVSMRDYLDTTKRRWVENYAEDLGLEKDRTGSYRFPSSIEDIKGTSDTESQTLADARSLFNYIYALENGYINQIDNTFKAMFNYGAETLSELGWGKGEEYLRDWGKGSATSTAKNAVFKMYLAANPQRQFVVQSHQVVQLIPLFPKYMGSGQWAMDLYRLGRVMRGYKGDAEAVEMYTRLKNSGMLDAVDANNLVRKDSMRLADMSRWQKIKTVASAPLKFSQWLGFDNAERFVLVTSWLAHYNDAAKGGKKLTMRDYDDIAGQARAFTYSMNRAGDQPYNRNTLNMMAQFLQVPHKAVLQPLTHRYLTPKQRLKLLTWNGIMYGVPAGVGSSLVVNMDDGPVKESISEGLEHVLLNEVFSAITGEEQSVDWGDLTPTDLHGMNEFLLGMWTTAPLDMVANSPAGTLIFGANPRITNAVQTAARWVGLRDDYEDPELDTKFTDVAIASANLFSGFSNAFKARYAFKTGKKISSLGNLTDADVTKFESAMQFFGFRTETEEGARKINEKLFEGKSYDGFENDVSLWYNELKRQLARKYETVRERDLAQRIITEGQRVFQDDPIKFRESLFNLVKNDVEQNQYDIFERVRNQMGWQSKSDLIKLLDNMPASDEKRILKDAIIRLGDYE